MLFRPLRESDGGVSRASTGNRGCGCRDCVLPSSAPGSGRPRSPAGKLVRRKKASFSVQRRGDLKEGVSPSFIVSIRGVKRGKKSKSSPSCVVLFSPLFSWTSKKKGERLLCRFAYQDRTPERKRLSRQGVGKKSKSSPVAKEVFLLRTLSAHGSGAAGR